MLTPSALGPSTYYKIGETVTFGWNYTSLSIPPAKIEPEETGQAPLLTGEYNLVIHDAAKDPSAVASAGMLGAFSAAQFGMYLRQSYTPRSGMFPLPVWYCERSGED